MLAALVNVVMPNFLLSQSIQISYPDLAKKAGVFSYLMKPRGLKMDTLTRSEFINGVAKFNCKEYPKGLYQVSVSGSGESAFLLLGNSNINLKYESGVAPVFENSEVNMILQKILSQNEQYHAERNRLSQIAQSFYEFDPHYKTKSDSIRIAYDRLHVQFNAILDEFDRQTPDEYISGVLIPVLKFNLFNTEADKKKYDNEKAFQHYEFFRNIDFSKEQLAGDYFFARKVNEYITYFGGRSAQAKQESCILLIEAAKPNSEVQRFVVETIMEAYFEMKDYEMVEFISTAASAASCQAPQLSGELKKFVEGAEHLQPGKKAPDISLKNVLGEYQVLSLVAKSHQYVIVFFWATWCPHCMDLISKLKGIYPELKARGIEIFAVALDDNYEEWMHVLAQYELPWINVSERKKWETQAAADYNIRTTPTLYLLSGNMTVRGRYSTFESLRLALQR